MLVYYTRASSHQRDLPVARFDELLRTVLECQNTLHIDQSQPESLRQDLRRTMSQQKQQSTAERSQHESSSFRKIAFGAKAE